MGIFDIFKRKPSNCNHTFTDTDRAYSEEQRKLNAEIKAIQKQTEIFKQKQALEEAKAGLELLQEELYEEEEPEEENDIDDMFLNILNKFMSAKQQIQQPLQAPQLVELSDIQIDEVISVIPKNYIKQAKQMSDETLMQLVKAQYPYISAESVFRAVTKIKAI